MGSSVGFVGALLLAVIFLVVHRDAFLRSALDVAALVASVALAGALLATLRLPSQIRARIVLMIGVSIATLYGMELFFFWDPSSYADHTRVTALTSEAAWKSCGICEREERGPMRTS